MTRKNLISESMICSFLRLLHGQQVLSSGFFALSLGKLQNNIFYACYVNYFEHVLYFITRLCIISTRT